MIMAIIGWIAIGYVASGHWLRILLAIGQRQIFKHQVIAHRFSVDNVSKPLDLWIDMRHTCP